MNDLLGWQCGLLLARLVAKMMKFFDCFIDIVVFNRWLFRFWRLQLHGKGSLTFFPIHRRVLQILHTLHCWHCKGLSNCRQWWVFCIYN